MTKKQNSGTTRDEIKQVSDKRIKPGQENPGWLTYLIIKPESQSQLAVGSSKKGLGGP